MNLYYAIVGDALHSIRKTKNKYNWKTVMFIYLTIYLFLNLLTLSMAIQLFTGYNPMIEILLWLPSFRSGHTYYIIMLIPCIFIVYFLIFYKNRYIYIYRNYKHRKGKLLIAYFIVSPILFFGLALLRDYLLKVGPFSG